MRLTTIGSIGCFAQRITTLGVEPLFFIHSDFILVFYHWLSECLANVTKIPARGLDTLCVSNLQYNISFNSGNIVSFHDH